MERVVNAAQGDELTSADFNELQDRGEAARQCTAGNDLGATKHIGSDTFRWMVSTAWATATLRLLDTTIDWRDRIVHVDYADLGALAVRPGQTDDYADWYSAATQGSSFGYLGRGAYSNCAGAGTPVSDGSPPLAGTAPGGVRSHRVSAGVASFYIYCDPTTGYLYGYNATGSSKYPYLEVRCGSATGKRP